jgi:hypothetical protein
MYASTFRSCGLPFRPCFKKISPLARQKSVDRERAGGRGKRGKRGKRGRRGRRGKRGMGGMRGMIGMRGKRYQYAVLQKL